MPLRVGPIATAVMYLRELVLDFPDPSWCGPFRRGLVALDRPAVVAVKRVQVTHSRGRADFRWGLVQRASLDRVAQCTRFVDWRDPELLVQQPRGFAVLAKRCRSVAGFDVEAHQIAMRRFMQGIGREAPLCVPDRLCEFADPLGDRD